MEILRTEHLGKVYGSGETAVRALHDVNLVLQKGEFAAVVGASGSGKSTLLNCIGGLDFPTEGKVILNGEDLFSMKERRRTVFRRQKIGFVFQSFHLIPELNVEQNILFPVLLDYQKPDRERLEEMLEVLGLQDRRYHLPGQLSGGQQQRAAIGRALIMRPALVLADEPTGNLDSRNSRDVMELLLSASRHYRQTVLMITHNRNLAASADRVFQVSDGLVRQLGETWPAQNGGLANCVAQDGRLANGVMQNGAPEDGAAGTGGERA